MVCALANYFDIGVDELLDCLYSITGYKETWDDVPLVRKQSQEIKVYIYLYTRLRFDPPANSFVTEAIEKQISEAEWRLNVEAEGAFES